MLNYWSNSAISTPNGDKDVYWKWNRRDLSQFGDPVYLYDQSGASSGSASIEITPTGPRENEIKIVMSNSIGGVMFPINDFNLNHADPPTRRYVIELIVKSGSFPANSAFSFAVWPFFDTGSMNGLSCGIAWNSFPGRNFRYHINGTSSNKATSGNTHINLQDSTHNYQMWRITVQHRPDSDYIGFAVRDINLHSLSTFGISSMSHSIPISWPDTFQHVGFGFSHTSSVQYNANMTILDMRIVKHPYDIDSETKDS